MTRRDTGFHRMDADWTRGRKMALNEAESVVRRQAGMSRKIALIAQEDAAQDRGVTP